MLNSGFSRPCIVGGVALSDADDETKEELPLPPLPPGLAIPPPLPAESDINTPEIPPLPTPPPPQGIDLGESTIQEIKSESEDFDDDFKTAWEQRKQENPALSTDKRDQMYGHIDRIATGEVGTLLDRFSGRFGSELDREIIVLRKKQQQEMRDVKPTVELISTPDAEFEEEFDDSEDELAPSPEMNELSDQFSDFFSVVNDLLGGMPDEFVNSFIESDDFVLFQSVGNDPTQVNEEQRKEFFTMINRVLGELPDDMVKEFVQSPGFGVFQEMGTIYGE